MLKGQSERLGRLFARSSQRRLYSPRAGQEPIHLLTEGSRAPFEVTEVEKIMIDNVKAGGPISFATYMQLCLSHPTRGYYMHKHETIGAKGDFITSPEISQVFGELLAIWMLNTWMRKPDAELENFRLIELGPGKGTLMDDVLRVVHQTPKYRNRLKNVHLVETSPYMRSVQKAKLHSARQKGDWQLSWHDSIEDIPEIPELFTMVIAHEFFDALPVNVIQRTQHGWQEVLINYGGDRGVEKLLYPDTLRLTTSSGRWMRVLEPTPSASSTLLSLLSPRYKELPLASQIEVSPASTKIALRVGQLLNPGCALIIDYGDDHVFGDSLRAFKDHAVVDIFHRPGKCDLTANVDFALLKEALQKNVKPLGPIPQGEFLMKMGIGLRTSNLARITQPQERRDAIMDSANRLVDPLGMGSQYKVLGAARLERDCDATENAMSVMIQPSSGWSRLDYWNGLSFFADQRLRGIWERKEHFETMA